MKSSINHVNFHSETVLGDQSDKFCIKIFAKGIYYYYLAYGGLNIRARFSKMAFLGVYTSLICVFIVSCLDDYIKN